MGTFSTQAPGAHAFEEALEDGVNVPLRYLRGEGSLSTNPIHHWLRAAR